MKNRIFALLLLLPLFSCESDKSDYAQTLDNPDLLHQSQMNLTDIIVHDIFSPPVASRLYAYASIAAYETMLPANPDHQSLSGQLNGLQKLPEPEADKDYNFSLAAVFAFNTVSKALIFSEDKMQEFEQPLYDSLYRAVPKEIYLNSQQYGESVAKAILAWANEDNYKQTRGFKYSLLNEPGKWSPTPPAYMDAIEPHWNRIRPFTLDSASQYAPATSTAFSTEADSKFQQEVLEVYEISKNLSEEQQNIAAFWDCNPYVMNTVGHVMYATKKITPGGHWMGIAQIAAKSSNADFATTAEAYARTSVALADAFISCWDEKYRSSVIRPETVINTFVDDEWAPLLQTPPFPEYPSGHSVISTAAAITLTELFGDNFAFEDDTEVKYGLPSRNFTSFNQAAEEAAISRIYGGIHFMPAIENGVLEGKAVGEHVVKRVATRANAEDKQLSVNTSE